MFDMWWLSVKRRRLGVDHPAMRAFLDVSLPTASSDFGNVEFLVADLETTSLDAGCGEIASIGWVPIKNGVIQLAEAEQHFSKIDSGVGQSAVIHQIRDSELDGAASVTAIMNRFLEVAAGKVLVFHNAELDMAFLNCLSKKLYAAPVLAPVVDTLQLERRRLLRNETVLQSGVLRLHSCRQRYNLPDYPGHDALTDALATAELLLAWAACSGGDRGVSLADCLL